MDEAARGIVQLLKNHWCAPTLELRQASPHVSAGAPTPDTARVLMYSDPEYTLYLLPLSMTSESVALNQLTCCAGHH